MPIPETAAITLAAVATVTAVATAARVLYLEDQRDQAQQAKALPQISDYSRKRLYEIARDNHVLNSEWRAFARKCDLFDALSARGLL